jgi:hypothetical protein
MKTVVATIALLAIPRLALACPVCFGNPNSAQTKAAQAGILALLGVTVAMLASIAGFFFVYLRRRIRLFEESNGGSF